MTEESTAVDAPAKPTRTERREAKRRELALELADIRRERAARKERRRLKTLGKKGFGPEAPGLGAPNGATSADDSVLEPAAEGPESMEAVEGGPEAEDVSPPSERLGVTAEDPKALRRLLKSEKKEAKRRAREEKRLAKTRAWEEKRAAKTAPPPPLEPASDEALEGLLEGAEPAGPVEEAAHVEPEFPMGEEEAGPESTEEDLLEPEGEPGETEPAPPEGISGASPKAKRGLLGRFRRRPKTDVADLADEDTGQGESEAAEGSPVNAGTPEAPTKKRWGVFGRRKKEPPAAATVAEPEPVPIEEPVAEAAPEAEEARVAPKRAGIKGRTGKRRKA